MGPNGVDISTRLSLRPATMVRIEGVLREFACWLATNAPEITSVADLRRRHIEAYKLHLAARPSARGGRLSKTGLAEHLLRAAHRVGRRRHPHQGARVLRRPAAARRPADDDEPAPQVATLVGDMAYSDGDVREAVEATGAQMVAKVPPATNGGRFPKTDFALDLDAEKPSATCPAGMTTTTMKNTRDHKGRATFEFVFPAATCAACPLREQCAKSRRGGRRVKVSVHERRIAAARAAQTDDPATVALLRARSKVERKIDHLQDLGMRQARYRGRRKTRLQAFLAAIVANVNRLDVLGAFDTAPTSPAMAHAA